MRRDGAVPRDRAADRAPAAVPAGPSGLVFASRTGAPVRRTTFRAKVWRPSLVRAGLLGKVVEAGPDKYLTRWSATGRRRMVGGVHHRERGRGARGQARRPRYAVP